MDDRFTLQWMKMTLKKSSVIGPLPLHDSVSAGSTVYTLHTLPSRTFEIPDATLVVAAVQRGMHFVVASPAILLPRVPHFESHVTTVDSRG
jgi:hypothetical protein